MTFEECLRNAEVIDSLDDKRRIKMYNILIWNDDMQANFVSRLEDIVLLTDIELLKNDLRELLGNIKSFTEKFNESIKKVKTDELRYEEMDDNLRNYLIEYAIRCRQELRIENSEIEAKMILENLKRKKEVK